MIRVVVADDHRIVREGVRRLLDESADLRVVGEASAGDEALALLDRVAADVLLLDVAMPRTGFVTILAALRERHPSVRVIVLSGYAEAEYAVRALKGGALGYVTKERSPAELVDAIRAAAQGRRFISPTVADLLADAALLAATAPAHGELSGRELETLRLLGRGLSVKEAAAELGLSAKTVSTYRSRLLDKLGLRSTAELIRHAIERNLV